MKGLKTILGIALATTALGGAVAFAAASTSEKASIEPAEAAVSAKTIYVDFSLNSKFQESGCNPGLRYWNGSSTKIDLVSDGNNIYHTKTTVPANVLTNSSYGFEFYCWGQEDTGNDCTTSWIFGNGVLQYDNYNYVCIGTYSSGKQNSIKGYGHYGADTANPFASASTQRVWICNENSNFYGNDDWGTPCKNVIGYTYNSQWYKIELIGHTNYDGRNYFYADIPEAVTDVHFMRMSRNSNHKYLVYQDAYVSGLEYGKCYYAGTANYGDFVNLSVAAVDKADAYLLRAVMEAYLTCSSSSSNGHDSTTIANVKATWFDTKAADGTNGDINTLEMSDYADGDTSYSGNKTKTLTVADKWNALRAAAGVSASRKIGNLSNNSVIIIVMVSSFVAVAATGAFFIIRKKKHQ